MKKLATTIRCLPRLGLDYTELRLVDVDVEQDATDGELYQAVLRYFARHGLHDAVFAVEVDQDGVFAIINDDAYTTEWGATLS